MSQEIPIQSFKLGEQGLTHIFGELEAKLMEAVWSLNEPNVQDVIDHLGGTLNYKTTMTVLNRLVEKGVLYRRKSGRAFVYTPIASREELLASVFDQMVRGMFSGDFRQIALTRMIETAEALDPQLLDDIASLIRRKKANEPGGSLVFLPAQALTRHQAIGHCAPEPGTSIQATPQTPAPTQLGPNF